MVTEPGSARGRPLKVLVSAVVCGPDEGSEPGAGWWWAVAAAERHEVWLLALDTSRTRIDAAVAARPDLALHPVYLRQASWLPGPSDDLRALRLRYLVWQWQAVAVLRRLHQQVGFDVAHHVTLASDWLPSAVATLSVPFVWGPVGGHTPPAWPLARWLGARWLVSEATRRAVTGAIGAVAGRRLARGAAVVVAQNDDAARHLARHRPHRAAGLVVEPNVVVDPATRAAVALATAAAAATATDIDIAPAPSAAGEPHGPTLVFAGRLVTWKGARLAVEALARPALDRYRLDVYGDGPDRATVAALAARLGVAHRVHLHGTRPRAEVLAALARAHALVLPSLNDSAGWVVAEAAALGCPVVCLDRGGPAWLVAQGAPIGGRPGTVVPARGDVPGALAAAVAGLGPRPDPSSRWDLDRLADLVDGWYHQALDAPNAPAVRSAAAPLSPTPLAGSVR